MNIPTTLNRPYIIQSASGLIEIPFKGKLLRLSQQDIDTLLSGLSNAWSVLYRIGLFDVWDTCIRTGFQSKNLQITLQEYDELSLALQVAYLQFD
ncbi:hypothetical protein GCM10028807_44900 [Spirosoma daeguense]